jgi:hypothetical protein
MTGRFTAFTVCGVITHSERSMGWPSLARLRWYSNRSARSAFPKASPRTTCSPE